MHGFRYAEISGYPGEPDPATSSPGSCTPTSPAAGSFESSSRWLDQLFRNIDWGQRGNFISVPTDCPQRDERLGWLGDAQIFARTACYNRDVAAFFGKWLDDVADAQLPSGAFPDIAPRLQHPLGGRAGLGRRGGHRPLDGVEDVRRPGVLERHFAAMTAWMDFIERGNPGPPADHRPRATATTTGSRPAATTPRPSCCATAYWAYDAALMAEIAEAVGRADDAAEYRALRAKIGAAFAAAFVAADGTSRRARRPRTCSACTWSSCPTSLRAPPPVTWSTAIEAPGGQLTTGFVGVGYLLPVLSSAGHSDGRLPAAGAGSFPSWRYMLDHGATTIWERWDGWSQERGFQSAWMNSFNHYSLGSVGEWLYRFVLGIDLQPGTAGLRPASYPAAPGRRSSTGPVATYRSVRGQITSSWRRMTASSRCGSNCRPTSPPASGCRAPTPGVRRDDGQRPAAIAGYPARSAVRRRCSRSDRAGLARVHRPGPGAFRPRPRPAPPRPRLTIGR